MFLTCIKPPFVIKIFVLSIFEWPLKTGFTVLQNVHLYIIIVTVSFLESTFAIKHWTYNLNAYNTIQNARR